MVAAVHSCGGCGRALVAGERVYQLAKGSNWEGAITPTYSGWDAILAEWHEPCLRESGLFPHWLPYVCTVCRLIIEDKAPVLYITCGRRPQGGWVRLEQRDAVKFIVHRGCLPEKLKSDDR